MAQVDTIESYFFRLIDDLFDPEFYERNVHPVVVKLIYSFFVFELREYYCESFEYFFTQR